MLVEKKERTGSGSGRWRSKGVSYKWLRNGGRGLESLELLLYNSLSTMIKSPLSFGTSFNHLLKLDFLAFELS